MLLKVVVVLMLTFSIQCKKKQAPKTREKSGVNVTKKNKATIEPIKDILVPESAEETLLPGSPSLSSEEVNKSDLSVSRPISDTPLNQSQSVSETRESMVAESAHQELVKVSPPSLPEYKVQDSRDEAGESQNNDEGLSTIAQDSELEDLVKESLNIIGLRLDGIKQISAHQIDSDFSDIFSSTEQMEHSYFGYVFQEVTKSPLVPYLLNIDGELTDNFHFLVGSKSTGDKIKIIRDKKGNLVYGTVRFKRDSQQNISRVDWVLFIDEGDLSGSSTSEIEKELAAAKP